MTIAAGILGNQLAVLVSFLTSVALMLPSGFFPTLTGAIAASAPEAFVGIAVSAAQSVLLWRHSVRPLRWIAYSAIGFSVGALVRRLVLIGALNLDIDRSAAMAIFNASAALAGLAVALAHWLASEGRIPRPVVWAAITGTAWALGLGVFVRPMGAALVYAAITAYPYAVLVEEAGRSPARDDRNGAGAPAEPVKGMPLPRTARAVLLLLPIFGSLAGYALDRAASRGALTKWEQIPAPPARPVEIAGGTPRILYVSAEDGSLYSCDDFAYSPRHGCWLEEQALPDDLDAYRSPCGSESDDWTPSRPPGKIADSLDTYGCDSHVALQSNFVLLDDGTLWSWSMSATPLGALGRLSTLVMGGCVAGGAISLVFLGISLRPAVLRRRRQASSD